MNARSVGRNMLKKQYKSFCELWKFEKSRVMAEEQRRKSIGESLEGLPMMRDVPPFSVWKKSFEASQAKKRQESSKVVRLDAEDLKW